MPNLPSRALRLEASLRKFLGPRALASPGGCELNLGEIYYGIRGVATNCFGRLYQHFNTDPRVPEMGHEAADMANIDAARKWIRRLASRRPHRRFARCLRRYWSIDFRQR